MSWSLNEIEGLARRATRGSGLSWGVAEEAGKAVRWLTAARLPGTTVLARCLTVNDAMAYDRISPAGTTGQWRARASALCPLCTGAVISDHAADIAAGRDIQLGATTCPLLLVPFVATAAGLTGATLTLSWKGATFTLGREVRIDIPDPKTILSKTTDAVHIRLAGRETGLPLPRATRGDIPPEIAKQLNDFAHRTYAPDTAESRLAGAGAGLTDND